MREAPRSPPASPQAFRVAVADAKLALDAAAAAPKGKAPYPAATLVHSAAAAEEDDDDAGPSYR